MNLLNPNFKIVGAAKGPHGTYGSCCVMNLATSIRSLDNVITTDCVVSCKGEITSDIMNILNSIPIDSSDYVATITQKFVEGMELTLSFSPSKKTCEFKFSNSDGYSIQTLSWG